MHTPAPTSPARDATPDACDTAPERLIRCVSSGYLSDGCSCQATVPSHVATAAWARELECTGARDGQFFSFGWRGGEWLGYGLGDGHVRGVYCPEHNARRAETSCGGRLSLAS